MITTLGELEACLGPTPKAVGLKVIDHLDVEAARWIAASPLAFIGAARRGEVAVTLAGGELGFAQVRGANTLAIACDRIDDAQQFDRGAGVGILFLVPGLGETLRVNGRVATRTDAAVEIEIDEVYVHCAKALLRSALWTAAARADVPTDGASFVLEARFLAVATADAEGRADVSPKGDPAGTLLRFTGSDLSYGERPGNRRKDSLKNILVQPRVAALALIPGANTLACIEGRARIESGDSVCAPFTVEGKTPKLVTTIEQPRIRVCESPVLKRVALWPLSAADHGINAAAVLTAHIKRSKPAGFALGLMRRAMTKTLMEAGLARDYKKRLY